MRAKFFSANSTYISPTILRPTLPLKVTHKFYAVNTLCRPSDHRRSTRQKMLKEYVFFWCAPFGYLYFQISFPQLLKEPGLGIL